MSIEFSPKKKKVLNFGGSGTWPNPGGIDTVYVSLQGGESLTANTKAGDSSAGPVLAPGGNGNNYQPQALVRVPVDTGGGNITFIIGAGAGGGLAGWGTIEWEE